jgi:hypothetical protein
MQGWVVVTVAAVDWGGGMPAMQRGAALRFR